MLPDLGRLIRLFYASIAFAFVLRALPGRWRFALPSLVVLWAWALTLQRLLREARPVAPDQWPPAGRSTLALATGSGIWRLDVTSGQAYPASSTGEPTLSITTIDGRLQATTPTSIRETVDWRTWALTWPSIAPSNWLAPLVPSQVVTAGLSRRAGAVLAILPDGHAGLYIGTGARVAPIALRVRLAFADRPIGRLADVLLARRSGSLYHVDGNGVRRLIASGLPPIFGISSLPADGTLAGSPAPIMIRPIPAEPIPITIPVSRLTA